MTKLVVAFRNFEKSPKNTTHESKQHGRGRTERPSLKWLEDAENLSGT
jgi:hypothetical protein